MPKPIAHYCFFVHLPAINTTENRSTDKGSISSSSPAMEAAGGGFVATTMNTTIRFATTCGALNRYVKVAQMAHAPLLLMLGADVNDDATTAESRRGQGRARAVPSDHRLRRTQFFREHAPIPLLLKAKGNYKSSDDNDQARRSGSPMGYCLLLCLHR
jgi:hypothetical protein